MYMTLVFIRKGGVGTKLNYRITFYAAKKTNFFALVRFELDTCNFMIHRPGNANIILYLFLQNMMNG
jgi:alanine-alpha-ketoisovalerate/valine-pyruvate aminotransferase